MPYTPDLSFISSGPVVRPESYADARAKSLSLQQLNQQLAAGSIDLAQKQREQADDAAYRNVVMQRAQQAAAPPSAAIATPPFLPPGSVALSGIGQAPALPTRAGHIGSPGTDYEGLARDLDARGAYRQAAEARKQGVEALSKRAVAAKDFSEAGNFDALSATKRADAVHDGMGYVLALPAEQQPAAYQSQMQRLVQQGFVSPEEAAASPYPGAAELMNHYQTVSGAKAQADQMGAAAEARQKNILADQYQARGMTDVQYSEKQKRESDARRENDAFLETQKQNAINNQLGQARLVNEKRHTAIAEGQLGVARGRLAVEEKRYGWESSGGVSPSVDMAVAGEMSPATFRAISRVNPGFVSQVKSKDPNFDEANLEKRFATQKEFNSTSISKAGGQALALNTLIHHADLYQKVAEALTNHEFRPGNAAYNAVVDLFGAAPPQNAALVARFLAGETGKVATGGVPAEGEINGVLKSLGNNASPEQIAGAGRTLLQIASGRAIPLIERVNDAKLGNVVHVIGPDAQEILARRGFDPKTMKPKPNTQKAGRPPLDSFFH